MGQNANDSQILICSLSQNWAEDTSKGREISADFVDKLWIEWYTEAQLEELVT